MTNRKPLTRTRLIGFAAMAVCALGYVGAGLALLAGKVDYLDMTHAALAAASLALIGEMVQHGLALLEQGQPQAGRADPQADLADQGQTGRRQRRMHQTNRHVFL